MRGFALSMVLDESMTVEDLKDVAARVLKQINDRKGPRRGGVGEEVPDAPLSGRPRACRGPREARTRPQPNRLP